MRILGRVFLSVVFVGLLVSLAVAQQRPFGGGGAGGGTAMLLNNEGVQKELKLTDDQIAQVKKVSQEVREKFKGEFEKMKDVDKAQRGEKGAELFKKVNDETNKSLASVLKPEQAKRLHQIQLQIGGSEALTEPDVEKALKLTDDQKDKIKTIREDARKDMAELRKDGFKDKGGEAFKKMAAVRKETVDKAMAVLTPEQKKIWQELTGAPFEVKFEFRRPDKNKN
jgi:Spy/CpxP family protein refolding chaperone